MVLRCSISVRSTFSHFLLCMKPLRILMLATLSAYVTIIFLIWFPIAMFSKVKLLWIGISFHLGIIRMMGLITFGVIMIGMELFFITDSEYQRLVKRYNSFIERVKKHYAKYMDKKSASQDGRSEGT